MVTKPEWTTARAFTLVELLVATGITVMIAFFSVLILGKAVHFWSRAVAKMEVQREARQVLDQLVLDLDAVCFRDDGAVWMAATILDTPDNSGLWEMAPRQKPAGVHNGSLEPTAADFAAARFGQAGVWLRFFTSARGRNDPSDLATTASVPVPVAYQIIRRRTPASPGNRSVRYLLHRSQVRPMQSLGRPGGLESGFNLDPEDEGSPYTLIAGGTNDGAQPGDPASVRHPSHEDNVIGENVIDFGVRLAGRDFNGMRRTLFPENEDHAIYFGRAPFPDTADVLVRVVTEEGARQLALLETEPNRLGPRPARYQSEAEWWWGLAESHSHVFVRRIALRRENR